MRARHIKSEWSVIGHVGTLADKVVFFYIWDSGIYLMGYCWGFFPAGNLQVVWTPDHRTR